LIRGPWHRDHTSCTKIGMHPQLFLYKVTDTSLALHKHTNIPRSSMACS
jgi:hypothetical protein